MKRPKIRRITLRELRRDASEVDDAPDLDPAEYLTMDPIIIEVTDESVNIVDGFHRAAGLIGWATAAEQKLDVITVPVVDATGYDEDTVAQAADGFGGERQSAAIRKILRAVKRGS